MNGTFGWPLTIIDWEDVMLRQGQIEIVEESLSPAAGRRIEAVSIRGPNLRTIRLDVEGGIGVEFDVWGDYLTKPRYIL